ncbi:MAG: glycerate kinase [Dermabacter sp.]|nr:glycerate kinase [Dermabacter sp.]
MVQTIGVSGADAPRVLIAPDKFKGTASAREVCEALARGVREAAPGAVVRLLPLADGGDGSVEAALSVAERFAARVCRVTGPTGERAETVIAVGSGEAVVEVATTSGLQMVPVIDDEAALQACSTGFGQALVHALDAVREGNGREGNARAAGGWRRVVAAIGGSAATDGGSGLLHELGLRFHSAPSGADGAGTGAGAEFIPTGGTLIDVARVEVTPEFTRLREALERGEVEVVVASDVTNPLLGERGAAAVFGPQKGASEATVARLEEGLAHLVNVLDAAGLPASAASEAEGAGASGGIGFALMLAGARVVSGADFFLDLLGFDDEAARADLVVTGEGSLDRQTLDGKLPAVMAARAHRAKARTEQAGPRVIAVAGVSTVSADEAQGAGIAEVLTLDQVSDRPTRDDPEATLLALAEAGRQLGRGLSL